MVVLHSTITKALGLFVAASAASFDDDTTWKQSSQSILSDQSSDWDKPYPQKFLDGYSILKHYGGHGPYSDRESYGIDRDPPASCEVDQVIMIKRHGERYPTRGVGARIEKSLEKLKGYDFSDPSKDLAFLQDWTYFVPSSCWYEAETTEGPYAGLLDARKHGKQYRKRYGHLWDEDSVVPIWAGDYPRVIDTAHVFGEGFFEDQYETKAAMNIVSEKLNQGANSLTPGCPTIGRAGCGEKYSMPQFKIAADRLNSQYPDLNLTAYDAFNFLSMAPYELNARGHSPWIDVFTKDEWLSLGYTQDLSFYYCAGPGNKFMSAVGSVFVNASLTLLNQGPSAGKLLFNFAHDTNIVPIVTALDILNPAEDLPLDRIPFGNPFQIGDIMPMGGHLTIERLSCDATAISPAGPYVRLVLNEAVVPLHSCQSGPGYSCPLSNLTSTFSESLPSYVDRCGIPESWPQSFDLWWRYSTSTEDNYTNKTQPCE